MSGRCRKVGISNYVQKCIKKTMHYCKQRKDDSYIKELNALIDKDSDLVNPLLDELHKEADIANKKQYDNYITELKNAQSSRSIQIEQLDLNIQQLKQKISELQKENKDIDHNLSIRYEAERECLRVQYLSKLDHIAKESSVRLDKITRDFMIKNGLE